MTYSPQPEPPQTETTRRKWPLILILALFAVFVVLGLTHSTNVDGTPKSPIEVLFDPDPIWNNVDRVVEEVQTPPPPTPAP